LPEASVVVLDATPVAALVAVTAAPGITAPVLSVTVPERLALTIWPKLSEGARRIAKATRKRHVYRERAHPFLSWYNIFTSRNLDSVRHMSPFLALA
jgi:hypothetical protein